MPNDWLPVPHYKQGAEGRCLPACARLVLAYLGHHLPEEQVAQVLRSYPFGTPASNVRYLESLGVSVTFGQASLARLRNWLQDRIPCIVFVQAGDLPYSASEGFHAVVVVGMDEHMAYLHDPASDTAPQIVSLDHFLLAWSEFDYAYAVIASA